MRRNIVGVRSEFRDVDAKKLHASLTLFTEASGTSSCSKQRWMSGSMVCSTRTLSTSSTQFRYLSNRAWCPLASAV